MDNRTASKFLDILLHDVEPITKQFCNHGNRAFGACVVKKSDFSVVVASSNRFLVCPLYHGEVHTIKLFYEIPEKFRPNPTDCYFISTHEPCFMCLASLTWSGFSDIFYIFNYSETSEIFKIPHDEIFLQEIFGVKDYNHKNKFWKCLHLPSLIEKGEDEKEIQSKINELKEKYISHSEMHLKICGEAYSVKE
eukprot:GHVP01061948.1.p1 GENE.GHVP01061948.1~~GHVP01061948.1.p1  ORF type:complete len:193 (-),score=31.43 GHVP01061948.1:44-622(-)